MVDLLTRDTTMKVAQASEGMPLVETYAPAMVLVDCSYRTLHFSGPTDRYLRVAPGEPSRDVVAMLREGLASKFRAAVRQASRDHRPVPIGGARVQRNGDVVWVRKRLLVLLQSETVEPCRNAHALLPAAVTAGRPYRTPKCRCARILSADCRTSCSDSRGDGPSGGRALRRAGMLAGILA
jgi:hypothetical protein